MRVRTLTWRVALTMLSVIAGLTGCRGAHDERLGTWRAEREEIGDTVVVRTLSGSVWGAPATMREKLAVDASGGIYVFDGGVPALRYFDASGEYVRTLGGKGSGPGEYRDAVLGLAIRSDGRIVLRDPRNARLNIYEPDGAPALHWPVSSGLFTANAMVLDTADHAYLKILLSPPEPNRPWNIGLLHLDDRGNIVDSIAPPAIAGEPTSAGGTFLPGKLWAWSPHAYPVVGVNSAYRFELRPPGGPVIRIERDVPTVQVLPEEHAELEARNDWYRKYQGQSMTSELPAVPSTKPPYRSFLIGEDGRVWVLRHVTAERLNDADAGTPERPPTQSWVEPSVYDVFEPDGTYLGEVRVPPGTSVRIVRGESAWGTRRGEAGEIYVVRLQVERGAGGAARD